MSFALLIIIFGCVEAVLGAFFVIIIYKEYKNYKEYKKGDDNG